MTASGYIHALGVLGVMLLLAYAYGRRMKDAGSDLVLTLIVAFVAAIVVVRVAPKAGQLPYLLLVDAAVATIAARISRTPLVALSEQARIVAAFSALKITFTIAAVLFGMASNARAAVVNGAFVVQILVAGGMTDGIITRLGHRVRGISHRVGSLFRRMGGE